MRKPLLTWSNIVHWTDPWSRTRAWSRSSGRPTASGRWVQPLRRWPTGCRELFRTWKKDESSGFDWLRKWLKSYNRHLMKYLWYKPFERLTGFSQTINRQLIFLWSCLIVLHQNQRFDDLRQLKIPENMPTNALYNNLVNFNVRANALKSRGCGFKNGRVPGLCYPLFLSSIVSGKSYNRCRSLE